MNKVILMGRLTRDPEVRWNSESAVARFTLAVDRKYKNDNEDGADFISCVAFGRIAEFVEKYFTKGLKIAITGRIHTGSYINKDGQRIYTTDVVVEESEFAESKSSGNQTNSGSSPTGNGSREATNGSSPANGYRTRADGFMDMEGLDEELPFN